MVATSNVVFNNNNKVFASTTLNCKLNISSDGKYLQQGFIGGTNPGWIMKGAFNNVIRFTSEPSYNGTWENQSYSDNNWVNRSAQMDAMKAAGINTIRLCKGLTIVILGD